MAITAAGMFALQLEKVFNKTQAGNIESTSAYVALILDTATPDFATMDFWDPDLSGNEVVTGAGYTAGGSALAGPPAFTVDQPLGGQLQYDATDLAWATSTITDAMAGVGYFTTGTSTTDELYWLSDFVTAASTQNGTFTIQWHTDGIFVVDFEP